MLLPKHKESEQNWVQKLNGKNIYYRSNNTNFFLPKIPITFIELRQICSLVSEVCKYLRLIEVPAEYRSEIIGVVSVKDASSGRVESGMRYLAGQVGGERGQPHGRQLAERRVRQLQQRLVRVHAPHARALTCVCAHGHFDNNSHWTCLHY